MNEDTKLGLLNIGSASEYLGISIDTLRRWEKKGRIQPLRSPGGHRYYSKADLDSLFGKRYSRDEETLRRTNEELGVTPDVSQQPSPIPEEPPALVPPIVQETNENINPLPAQMPAPPPEEYASPVVAPVLPQTPEIPNILHPIEVQEPVQVSPPVPEVASAKEIPQEVATVPNVETVPSIPNILLPERENNKLSEDEIEKRINTIIKREEKKGKSNTFLVILSAIFLMADIALLYFWFTSSRISSPIP